jgi:hypothetical protein
MRYFFILFLFIGFLKITPAKADAGLSVAAAVIATGFIVAVPFFDEDQEENIEDEDEFFNHDLSRSSMEDLKNEIKMERLTP